MKKLICVALALVMLMCAIPGVALAENTFGWTASSAAGSTAIDSVASTRGNAVAFRAWGTTEASMSAQKSQGGAYGIAFSIMVSDLSAVRNINASGIDMLTIDKAGLVKSGDNTLAAAIVQNRWYDVELVVYPIAKTYTVSFDGASCTSTATSIPALSSIALNYTEIETDGATTLISDPAIDATSEPGTATEDAITYFQNNNSNGTDTATSSTRTYNSSYPDPTGSGRGNIFACTIQSTGEGKWNGGEFQSKPNTGPSDRTKMAVISADFYVPAIEAGQTAPMVTQHELIGYANGYYWFFKLNHQEKKLYYSDNTQNVQLTYTLGQWMTAKAYLDFPNDKCIVHIYAEDGSYIGGAEWTVDFDTHSKLSANIGRYGLQFGVRDKIGPNNAYIDDYCWNYVTNTPVFTETVPYYSKTTVGVDDDIIFKVKGGNISPASLSAATVKINGTPVSATVSAAGPQGVRVNPANSLLPDTQYTVTLEGVKDIKGTAIMLPGIIQFKTKPEMVYGNLEIAEGSGSATASIPVKTTAQNLNLYAAAFDADNSMAATPSVQTATGAVNNTIETTVTASYSGAAEAYLWDDSMNIITPGVSTDEETFANAAPCNITVTKSYDPVEKFTIKGTANRGAAIKFYKVLNKGELTESKELIYLKEVNAHANGYFETSFESAVTGDVELLINVQDGLGIQTIAQKIYSPVEAANAIDDFNYLDDNPTYDPTDSDQYNAMVAYYDNLIKEHYQLLGINLTEYTGLSKYKFADILLTGSGTYALESDVLDKYNMALATAKFDAAADAATVEELITAYTTPYNFASSQTYAYYNTLAPAVKQKIYANMALINDYEDMSDVVHVFEEQAILAPIECATVNSEINAIVGPPNTAYIGLDLSVFNSLNDTSAVTSQVKGVKYESVQLFKEDFTNKTTAAKNAETLQQNNNTPPPPPAATGGGGGSVPYVPPKEDVSLPVTEEIVSDVTTPSSSFEDIRLVPWAEESIRFLVQKGVVNGKSETSFAPNDNVKRCEFVKMIALAFPEEDVQSLGAPFRDVEAGAWYEEYVEQAYSRGIINGKSETEFGVNDNITREEIVVMLYRVAVARNIDLSKTKSVVFYDDAEISDWSREAVYVLAETEIVNGMSANTFSAKNSATRAEAAKLVYCLMQREAE